MIFLEILVKHHGTYKDGGTECYIDENGGVYYIDNRINSTTKGKIYNKYPSDNGARILPYVKLVNKL